MMKRLLPLAAALPLAACLSFGGKVPDQLLVLSPTQPLPVGQDKSTANATPITIDVPVVPQALSTARIPVQVTPTTIAYVKDAQWAEPPARLFARLVADTLSANGRIVLSDAEAFSTPSAKLAGQLTMFGVDSTTREAIVTYDAALTRSQAATVEKRRFEARVPVAEIDAASVGPALNTAANQVAGQVAGWVGAR